ncbi:FHA domain-containing protein FhaB/FipA [Corynebacterium bovis]|uniref:FHA domain-containing protein FhaB/FipA n=1 Tax=Corynebacterium bovis TaxID=36808 RepID=UPI000F64A645|nr:FHA domain-containing protein [Corynebacterium bovis]RRO78821.1 FHA domain-containing protein [Corynebacterium bovis]RRO79163.1 FHA domain-containing protein [Corynebacterium bovis]RRO79166.1 FHA domain-containing protein [Corynebacterium bovis]RRO92218.1 FHA domain-containing protein [Corynebacterium bovis]
MQTTVLLLAKIGLLVLLWFFVWMTLRALRADANRASGLRAAADPVPPVVAAGGVPAGQPAGRSRLGRGLRRAPALRSLTLTTGPLAGTTLDLEGYREVTIGRSAACTLVVEDDFASASHARLSNTGSGWYVEDLDSRNGTFLDGLRIDQPESLSAGQEIRIGQTHVRMEA